MLTLAKMLNQFLFHLKEKSQKKLQAFLNLAWRHEEKKKLECIHVIGAFRTCVLRGHCDPVLKQVGIGLSI
jgi:hypothetical protein